MNTEELTRDIITNPKWCAPSTQKKLQEKPLKIGEYLWAANKHVCTFAKVDMRHLNLLELNGKEAEKGMGIINTLEEQKANMIPAKLPSFEKSKHVCSDCCNSGFVMPDPKQCELCIECGGEGELVFSTPQHQYHVTCESCNGKKIQEITKWVAAKSGNEHKARPCTNMQCFAPFHGYKPVEWMGFGINPYYLTWLKDMPDLKVYFDMEHLWYGFNSSNGFNFIIMGARL